MNGSGANSHQQLTKSPAPRNRYEIWNHVIAAAVVVVDLGPGLVASCESKYINPDMF